jgi:uncharacterized protein YebE (UPF0316 family)
VGAACRSESDALVREYRNMDRLIDAALSWSLPLPVLIFASELAVVTLDTIRTIFIARGRKGLSSFVGLLGVSIWLFAISQVMENLGNLACYVGYAAGFTAGTFLGIRIEEKLALGTLIIRIITNKDASNLIGSLRHAMYGVTTAGAQGATGPVQVIYTMIRRKQLADVVRIIKHCDPTTFYSVEDLRSANGGVFQIDQSRPQGAVPTPLGLFGECTRAYFPLPMILARFRRRSARTAAPPDSQLCGRNHQIRAEPAQMVPVAASK